MLTMWVKVRVKPDKRDQFQGDRGRCARLREGRAGLFTGFNVLQDQEDPNVYYFYEVYRDEAALEEHRKAPHYAVWRAAADTLDGPVQATRTRSVFPAAADYWSRNK